MSMSAFEAKPDYKVPPGRYLAEHLDVYQISKSEFAERCGVSIKHINGILSGKSSLKPKTAMAFEMVLGVPAKLWLGLENSYQLRLAYEEKMRRAKSGKSWAKQFPVDDLMRLGCINKSENDSEMVINLLRFFGLESIDAWKSKYNSTSVSYLRSSDENHTYALTTTWLRLAELEIRQQDILEYNKTSFRNALIEIKEMTTKPFDKVWPKLVSLCNNAGVGISSINSISELTLHGAAWWYSPKIAVIQINPDRLKDDKFWFVFFHEAAHILLHEKKIKHLKSIYIDTDRVNNNKREIQANKFASNMLVPKGDWENFLVQFDGSKQKTIEFSRKQKIAPGIVMGLLERDEIKVNFDSKSLIKTLSLSSS